MEENKFFKTVWRLNSLLFALAGLLGILIMLFAGYQIVKDTFRDRNVRNIVNVAEDQDVKEKWSLGNMNAIAGTDIVTIPLNSDQSYSQSYYSKSGYSVRNYLFIDTKTNEKYWLLQTNKYLLPELNIISEKSYSDPDYKAEAILFEVIKHDTNKDERLTTKDKITIALSLPSGKKYEEVLNDIDFFVGHTMVDSETIMLIYQIDNVGYSAYVSLIDFSLSNKSKLPNIENDL